MTTANVSQIAVEVLRAGFASAAVSQTAVEVLVSHVGAARSSQSAVEVLFSYTSKGVVSQYAVEVLFALAAPADAYVSQIAVEVLWASPQEVQMGLIVLSELGRMRLLEQKREYLNGLDFYLYAAVAGGTPTDASTFDDFTLVDDLCNAGLAPAFTAPSMGSGGTAEIVAPPVVWTFSYDGGVPLTLAGIIAVDPDDVEVVYSQAFETVAYITAAGQQFSVPPRFLEASIA